MDEKNSCVAVYDTHSEAEEAIKKIQKAGFDVKKLSILGRGYHSDEHAVGYYNTGDRVKFWGKLGAFWGGIWGLLFSSAFLWIPGIGPLAMGGPLVSVIVGGLESAAVAAGVTAVGAALYSIGIPKDSIIKYETALKADKFLVIVQGDKSEVERAETILKTGQGPDVTVHLDD